MVITKLPNTEQSYKGKVKTHKSINRQNQSTTGKPGKPQWPWLGTGIFFLLKSRHIYGKKITWQTYLTWDSWISYNVISFFLCVTMQRILHHNVEVLQNQTISCESFKNVKIVITSNIDYCIYIFKVFV